MSNDKLLLASYELKRVYFKFEYKTTVESESKDGVLYNVPPLVPTLRPGLMQVDKVQKWTEWVLFGPSPNIRQQLSTHTLYDGSEQNTPLTSPMICQATFRKRSTLECQRSSHTNIFQYHSGRDLFLEGELQVFLNFVPFFLVRVEVLNRCGRVTRFQCLSTSVLGKKEKLFFFFFQIVLMLNVMYSFRTHSPFKSQAQNPPLSLSIKRKPEYFGKMKLVSSLGNF